jgi:peptidoglycan/LPS O-acetylase OafA/YrhL
MGERAVHLDGWRGTAIVALLIGHFVNGFGHDMGFGFHVGRLGVELFFVLSGLLMANLLFVRRVTIPTFYKRRVSRIFPALYVYLLLITIVVAVAYRTFEIRSIAAVFLLYFNYYAAGNGLDAAVQYQHIWSLCIEEHSYILLSLVAIVSRRSRIKDHVLIGATVLMSWALIVVYTAVTNWDYYTLFWRTEARLGSVFCSAWLVCWLRDGHRPLVRGGAVLVPLVAGVVLQAEMVPDAVKYTVGTALLAVAVTHAQFASEWLLRPYRMKWLAQAGVLSYSIYLWQQPFMHLRGVMNSAVCMAGAIAMGVMSYYLLENPARRWLNARWSGHRDTDTVLPVMPPLAQELTPEPLPAAEPRPAT